MSDLMDNYTITRHFEKSLPFSPFQACIPEILGEIFSQACITDNSFESWTWDCSTPINIAAVCQHWRAVSLSLPRLWSTFEVSPHNEIPFRYPWNKLHLFAKRSGQKPLNLKIEPSRYDLEIVSSFIEKHQHRFQAIDINWIDDEGWNYVDDEDSDDVEGDDIDRDSLSFENNRPSIVLSDLPVIETLCVMIENNSKIVQVNLTHTYTLRRLNLSGSLVLHLADRRVFENLVSLVLEGRLYVLDTHNGGKRGLTWHDCLQIIQASPVLEEFDAKKIEIYPASGTHFDPMAFSCVCLPKLSTLRLRGIPQRIIQHVLGSLSLPGLKEFSLCLFTRGACGLNDLLVRSNAALRSLTFDGCDCAELRQCLRVSPSLSELVISDDDFDNPELQNLIIDLTNDQRAQICTQLESITFDECGSDMICVNEVESMILSRWNVSTGEKRYLKKVNFYGLYYDHVWPFTPQIRKCREEGLEMARWKNISLKYLR